MTPQIKQRAQIIAFGIANNSSVAKDALCLLNQNQTPEERQAGYTLEYNLVGVDGLDCRKLIPLLERLECSKCNGVQDDLNLQEIAYLKRTLPKYATQLAIMESVGAAFPYDAPSGTGTDIEK